MSGLLGVRFLLERYNRGKSFLRMTLKAFPMAVPCGKVASGARWYFSPGTAVSSTTYNWLVTN